MLLSFCMSFLDKMLLSGMKKNDFGQNVAVIRSNLERKIKNSRSIESW